MNEMQRQHTIGCVGAAQRRRAPSHGFTLVEVLVSLVIFGIISLALSLALAESLRGQTQLATSQDQAAIVRVVFDVITRDLHSAYPSLNSSSSIFIAGGAAANPASTNSSTNSGSNGIQASTAAAGSLLAFTSLAHRIQADDLETAMSSADDSMPSRPQPTNGQPNLNPQWDCALIRYDLDQQQGALRRTVTAVPNPQALTANGDSPIATLVADHIVSLSFRYWDGIQMQWRTDWDYEQVNQSNAAGTSSQTGSTTGQTGATTGQTGASTTGSGSASTASTSTASTTTSNGADTYLPSGVEVTLVMQAHDGSLLKYVTLIPILVTQPQSNLTGTATPPTPPTPASGVTPSVDVGSGD